jgi:hypothetical protein
MSRAQIGVRPGADTWNRKGIMLPYFQYISQHCRHFVCSYLYMYMSVKELDLSNILTDQITNEMSARNKGVVAALVRYASTSPKTTSRSRPKPRPSGAVSGASDQLVPGSPPLSSVQPASSVNENETWVEVKDPKSNQIYYWNKSTNETTAVGESKPGPLGRQQAVLGPARSLVSLVGMGAGMGLVFALIARVF